MSLIMACGGPAAGTSTRMRELADYFVKRGAEVEIVSDSKLGIKKSDYMERDTEKAARAKQMSAVKRLLSPRRVVILDSMNYIKGFRYQLFCEAKQAKVTSLVVYVATPKPTAEEFNTKLETPWPSMLLDQLYMRFEEPNSMNRWDSPLFLLLPSDELPAEEIYSLAIERAPPKPNAATQRQEHIEEDYLKVLNETTSQIAREALRLHALSPAGPVTLRGQQIELPYVLTPAQLTRIRRNFVAVNKNAAMPKENIEKFFVQFMQSNWDVVS